MNRVTTIDAIKKIATIDHCSLKYSYLETVPIPINVTQIIITEISTKIRLVLLVK